MGRRLYPLYFQLFIVVVFVVTVVLLFLLLLLLLYAKVTARFGTSILTLNFHRFIEIDKFVSSLLNPGGGILKETGVTLHRDFAELFRDSIALFAP